MDFSIFEASIKFHINFNSEPPFSQYFMQSWVNVYKLQKYYFRNSMIN